jgi:hypothetical protein
MVLRPRDRGAASVEALIALPVFLLLVLGFIEVAGLVQSQSATVNAVAAAGRMASVAGADPMADQLVLSRMAQEVASLGSGRIDYVVIWHAAGPGEGVPEACRPDQVTAPNGSSVGVDDGGVDALGACNVYLRPQEPGGAFAKARGQAVEDPGHYFGCQGLDDPDAAQKLDCSWPGKARRAVTSPRDFLGTAAPPDFVGVYAHVVHQFHTSIVLGDVSISDTAVSLIEPHGYEF